MEVGSVSVDSKGRRTAIDIPGAKPWPGYDEQRANTAVSPVDADSSARDDDQIKELNEQLGNPSPQAPKIPKFCESLRDGKFRFVKGKEENYVNLGGEAPFDVPAYYDGQIGCLILDEFPLYQQMKKHWYNYYAGLPMDPFFFGTLMSTNAAKTIHTAMRTRMWVEAQRVVARDLRKRKIHRPANVSSEQWDNLFDREVLILAPNTVAVDDIHSQLLKQTGWGAVRSWRN